MSSDQTPRTPAISASAFQYPMPGADGKSRGGQPVVPNFVENPITHVNSERQAHDAGVAEGMARSRAEFEKAILEARKQVEQCVREFQKSRDQYFGAVENEVVQLSLAIARKIIHRESQLDPMLLAGVVRVALDKIVAGTSIRLKTNPADLKFWQDFFSKATDIQPAPEINADPAVARGECKLETDIGSTSISFETQLKEIEQGFLDLLHHRDQVRA